MYLIRTSCLFSITAHPCFSFFYRLDRWFSRLNGYTLVIVWALYSLLFGVSTGFLLKAVPWPIICYFYKWLLGWRVVPMALMPYLPISIDTSTSMSSLLSFTQISSLELYGPAIGCNLGWIGRSDISA